MALVWLLVWFASSTPALTVDGSLNEWAFTLIACVAIDAATVLFALRRSSFRTYLHAFGATWEPGRGWVRGEPDDAVGQR